MPVCIACSRWGEGPLCSGCRFLLQPAAHSAVAGLQVASAFAHESVARRLVHLLKYQGNAPAGRILGSAMASVLPSDATALVPVPRALARKMRYGIDPAVSLARQVGFAAGLPVVPALRAQIWWPAHAGMDKASRRSPRFRTLQTAPSLSVLVDDVFTTGATLATAGSLLGISRAVTATRAGIGRCG